MGSGMGTHQRQICPPVDGVRKGVSGMSLSKIMKQDMRPLSSRQVSLEEVGDDSRPRGPWEQRLGAAPQGAGSSAQCDGSAQGVGTEGKGDPAVS